MGKHPTVNEHLMKLLLATSNSHKAREIGEVLNGHVEIETLKDIGYNEEIPETGLTLIENAQIKSRFIKDRFRLNCLADDSGLEVDALDGAPGVYSARFAGWPKSDDRNMDLLLSRMEGILNRKARFVTVISLEYEGREYLFEGVLNGSIIGEKRGKNGFGYDPVFMPEGFDKTLAEMSPEEKNEISHRAIAVRQLADFFKTGRI